MITGADAAREAMFNAVFSMLLKIAKNDRPIEPEDQMLYDELREWAARCEAARKAEDLEAMRHYVDELNLLGDTLLGRLLAKGYTPLEG